MTSLDTLWPSDDPPIQGLGLMRLEDTGWGDPDRDPAALVRAAVESGVTLLDTAEMYGNEELVGRAVAGRRDDVVLCSKFGVYFGTSGGHDDWSIRADAATVHSAIDGSLGRLGVEVVDLYYLHHRSEETPIEETVGAMAELIDAGKIRAIGLSNVTVEDVRRAHAVHPVAAVQEQWSVTERGVEEMLPTLSELGIALIAHSPFGHGALHERPGPTGAALTQVADKHGTTPGQVALAWVHHHGRESGTVTIPLPGTTRVGHLRSNVDAAALRLGSGDLELLDALAAP